MKKKKFAFLSLILAVLMALSLVLVACGGGEEDKKPSGNEPGGNEPGGNEPGGDTGDEADVIRGDVVEGSGAVATISDTSLEGKFWAMYPLEDSLAVEGNENYVVAAAINPYTGAAQASLTDDDEMEMYYGENTQLVANPTTTGRGNSKYVFDTDSTHISLPAIPDSYFSEIDNYEVDLEAAEKTGLSVSFWAYNNESPVGTVATGQASDWSNVMTNGFAAVTWGNITNIGAGNIAVYPANHAYLGRGAYTATSYPLAQQALSTEQLSARPASVPTNTYYVYNAINGGRLEADNESVAPYVVEMLNDMAKTWRYVTINIDYEEGVSFYNNGLLVYRYAPDAIDSTAGSTAYDWDRLYSEFIYGVSEGNREYCYLNMFNAESGIYVDDILVGASLTMDEVETLYEDLAGLEAGTVDNTLSSAVSDEEKLEAEVAAQAKGQKQHLEARTAIRNALIATTEEAALVPVTLGTADITANPASFAPTLITIQRLAYDNNTNWSWDDTNFITPEETDAGFTFTVEGYSVGKTKAEAGVTDPNDACYYMLVSLGLWNTSGSGDSNACFRPDHFLYAGNNAVTITGTDWAVYENGSSTPTDTGMPIDWDAWRTLIDVCKVKMTIDFVAETDALTITYELAEPDAGVAYTASQEYSGGTATGTYTVPEIAYKVVITATVDLLAENVAMRLYNDHSAFFITSVDGGTLS